MSDQPSITPEPEPQLQGCATCRQPLLGRAGIDTNGAMKWLFRCETQGCPSGIHAPQAVQTSQPVLDLRALMRSATGSR